MTGLFILTIVTYLGGSAWGPQVSVVPGFETLAKCKKAEAEVHRLIDELNKTNIAGGAPHMRQIVKTSCK